jgi:hypothetical protein
VATARILSWPGWQGMATDMQHIMEVEHRGWPLSYKIFRMWEAILRSAGVQVGDGQGMSLSQISFHISRCKKLTI